VRGRAVGRRRVKALDERVAVAPWADAGPEGWLPDETAQPVPAGFLSVPVRRAALATADRYARRLAARGAEVMVIADAGGEKSDQNWVEHLDAVGGLTAIATRHGLRLAVYPHADLERFLVNSEADLCIDAGYLRRAGIDPVELIEAFPDRIRHVHLEQADDAIVEALRRHRYDGWITFEQAAAKAP
jgi:inosose dehydratase